MRNSIANGAWQRRPSERRSGAKSAALAGMVTQHHLIEQSVSLRNLGVKRILSKSVVLGLAKLTTVAGAACDSAKAEVILTDTLNSLGTCSSCGPSRPIQSD
jgi:hypothetical protein